MTMFEKSLNIMMLVVLFTTLAACSSTTVRAEPDQVSTIFPSGSSPAARLPAQTAIPEEVDQGINSRGFTLTSPDVIEGGTLPAEYTCDGAGSTLALTWSGAPAGTRGYAVLMQHIASPADVHWYWIVYDIPSAVTSLPKNSHGIGTLGSNSVNSRTEYAPPCSKGPGPKVYTYTVYALSASPQFSVPASEVNRGVFLEAIQDITLASAELRVTYTRK
jgi:phosphatidylethanolamine-binding protein (PEBP) family uncharacterized protein